MKRYMHYLYDKAEDGTEEYSSVMEENTTGRYCLFIEAQAEIDVTYGKAFVAGKKNGEETMQDEIDALVTALDTLKDKYMAVQYPMMWLHDVVKIDPEVEQADRLTNKYKHKGE